ncbi:MAG: hypothetical protein EWV78_19190 [Microcystis aeruginosa Ma_MB_F_20061100_S20D]|uniref:Uncharacterized protein n=1 Tax=Microcystis aeruginosa Ma_MB_F_20061100_S20D TaxID=2486253 RepID=A0A552EBV8_MICAE|nr:MAG: hypothetical protein EWV78_19190 [Microcystis aeruginosa Ma_MB_F_20061100_S20D]
MPKSRLESSVEAFRSLTNREIERGRVSGTAAGSEFSRIVLDLENAELLISSNSALGNIVFAAPSAANEYFAKSLSDLLAGVTRRKKCPAEFYIAELDYFYRPNDTERPEAIQAYLDTVSLVESLSKLAEHGTESSSTKLIFFHKEKIELKLDYDALKIRSLPGLRDFSDRYMNDEIHADQKKTIIKSVLLEFSKEFEGRDLDVGLINDKFEELSRRVSSGYQLYVSEFSFQKIKAEIEKSKFEFISKINKVFSDIQNQLLTVPAALIIAGSQFEPAEHVTLKNCLILAGVLAFTVFMLLLIVNQRNTLQSIYSEIDNEWGLIKKKHNAIKEQFDKQYLSLERRYRYQYLMLEVVAFIVVSACAAAVLLFGYNSANQQLSVELAMFLGFALVIYIFIRAFVAIPKILSLKGC